MSRSSPFGSVKLPVAVLGATGAVGQAFVRLLVNHPWFDLVEVAASERSTGRTYGEATRWIGDDIIPARIAKLVVQACDFAHHHAELMYLLQVHETGRTWRLRTDDEERLRGLRTGTQVRVRVTTTVPAFRPPANGKA